QYQREAPELFEQEDHVGDPSLSSRVYFDIAPRRNQGNMLRDKISSFFGGGGGQSKPASLALDDSSHHFTQPPPRRLSSLAHTSV
ncbi:unnamed protein product, partial [Tilletia controversa]